MKRLFIIRHGKSDWNQGVRDFDRPLNSRGIKDAPEMGKYLLKNYTSPDIALSSSANRAISTARLLMNELTFKIAEILQRDNLYHASVKELLDELSLQPNSANTIFVFGHNPGLSDLVSYLSGEPTELKTCCIAILDLQVENWNELSRETCILHEYVSPRQI